MTQVEVKVEVEVRTHVEVQVEAERTTHVPMQADTRLRIRPEVLPDVQRGALRETQRRVRGEFAGCRRQLAVNDQTPSTNDRMSNSGASARSSAFV